MQYMYGQLLTEADAEIDCVHWSDIAWYDNLGYEFVVSFGATK